MRIITTSWDDGHPLDYRVAELLNNYNLPATFYIPRYNKEHVVMNENQIKMLAEHFEIGGHTLNHTRILNKSKQLFEQEIHGCFEWLLELLGVQPNSFCFPGGIYNENAITFCVKTGFKVIRTTELLSTKLGDNYVIPTTLQLFNHKTYTYFRHLLKRGRWQSLLLYMNIGAFKNLNNVVEKYIEHIIKNGGCFHLWGHSWEIEELGLWKQVEEIFRLISSISEVHYVTNGELLTAKKL